MQWYGLSEKEVSQIQQEIKVQRKKEKDSSPRKAGKKEERRPRGQARRVAMNKPSV